jgi:hypothetical protein
MKTRIRTIKPEAHTDEDLWDLEQETGLPIFRAFTGLWCHADKEGRFEWRPRPLKAGVLPYWDGDFSRVLDALASRGFVRKYACDGREFGVIDTFRRHQFINGKEPESELPEPPEPEQNQEVPHVENACSTREGHVPHVPIPSLPYPVPIPDPRGGAGGDSAELGSPQPDQPKRKRGKPPDPMLRETQIPDDFQANAENTEQARSSGLDLAEEILLFRAYAKKNGRVCLDWQADFSGWLVRSVRMRRENQERRPRAGPPRGRVPQDNAGKTGFEGVKRL